METRIIEAVNGAADSRFNHGKFMLGRFSPEEREMASAVDSEAIIRWRWSPDMLLVHDLETGEGALFRPGGLASADLRKHSIWVCPLFEPFLEWLYAQDVSDLQALPALVELPDAEKSLAGYRRTGRGE